MNCHQVEKLLPLYAGHDLDERREQLMTLHLQRCVVCAGAAADYREARELMHGFAPPASTDEVYADLRQSVWRRIEAESSGPSLFESMTAWFRPRFVWATAAAICLLVATVGLYSLGKRLTVRPQTVVSNPKSVLQPEIESIQKPGSLPLNPGKETPRRQTDKPRRPRKTDRMVSPDRADSVVAYSPDTQPATIQSSSPVKGRDNLDVATRDSEKTLRMEIQTKNPNIRIIWFSQQDQKPVAGQSKGI